MSKDGVKVALIFDEITMTTDFDFSFRFDYDHNLKIEVSSQYHLSIISALRSLFFLFFFIFDPKFLLPFGGKKFIEKL